MSRLAYRSSLAGAIGLVAIGIGLPTTVRADTFGTVFDITYNGCSSNCFNLPSFGTVSVSGNGTTTLTFDVDLANNVFFQSSGNGTTFQFSLTGATVTAANVSGLTTGQGWTFVAPPNQLDNLGTFLFGFQCGGLQGANTCGNTLDFTLNLATNGTLTTETGGSHGALYMGLDLANCTGVPGATGTTCGTGPFGATLTTAVPGPIVGAGLPGLVLACGGLLALARRRRQKVA